MKKIIITLLMIVAYNVNAQYVTTNTELSNAISAASAGTTIVLKNQIWTNVQISINKTGTMANPITIKAETPGNVFFEGVTNVKLGGSYINFEGVIFRNPPASVSTSTAIIDFRTSSSAECHNCKVTNITIDAFNQGESQQTSVFKWILLRGTNNEVSYSSFLGKHGVGSIINDNRDTATPNYHKIHHNYFANRTPQGTSVVNDDNDQDAIRIGNSSTSLSDSFTEVYDNYFYNFVGEIEVISNKSGSNKYYNNTFEDYSGALTLRHGDNCEVFNNFFLANGKSFSGGIRVMGENHKIYNNYVQGTRAKYPNNSSTNGLAGINIHNGILNSALNGYYQVKNAIIVNNTFVDCDLGIRVGATFSSSTQNQAPQDVVIGNNLMFENTTKAIQVTTQLIGTSSKYENNIKQNGLFDSFGSVAASGNLSVTSGLLQLTGDLYKLPSNSPAIDYGTGTYNFLTNDVFGGIRNVLFDAGAEEYGAAGTLKPYKQTDVGVKVGFGAYATLSNNKVFSGEKRITIYPIPATNVLTVTSEISTIGFVKIFDMSGKLLFDTLVNSKKIDVNLNAFSKGVYILDVDGYKSRFVVK